MARPIVRYLDPVSGEYEFATVVDIGDLRNLNTTIKSDIVGAINSIISDGVHNPVSDEKIEDLERIINSLKDGSFKINDFGSIDEYLKQQFLNEIDKINAQNRVEIQSVLTELDTSVNVAVRDYQEKVAAQNTILESAENTLADARGALEAKAREVETAKIGLSKLETEFNELDSYISTNVRTIDFDNFNAMIEDYETVVTQASDKVGADMSGSTLSYLTGRVSDAEAKISAQADEITSRMSYDEFQYMPVPKYSYGENLLFDTFDFGDAWNGKNGAQVISDTFLFGKVVAFNSPTGSYETRADDLTIGESYVFSAYVNTQPSEKSPSQVKYEPISRSYDPTDFKIQIGDRSFNPGVYEDLSGINGWVRVNQEFVADAVNPPIAITPAGINSQSEVAYMAMPKLEKGLTVTPWQPHVKDNYATMSSTQSMIRQQANSITAFVTEVSELDDSYKQATSTFKMLADGFKANTEALEAYEDAVTRYGTEYSNINGKFEQKIWKDDFEAVIEDINIDNRNRVFNSDFIRNEISSSDRRLIVEDWSLNSDWTIKTIDNNEYLSRTRTGLAQNLITSASSRYFPVKNRERILFGFDLIHSGLDNDQVFAVELFDISNKRLLKQEFSLSSLTKVGNRYHGSFNISTPGVEKGSVVLQLPRNGSVSFTKISFQSADIGSVDWTPAPEDSWIIQSKLATYISQVEDEITIGGTGQKIDTLTGLLTEDGSTFTLNPDKIATEVFNSQTYDDMGFVNKTNFEQTADGWMKEITSEGRLAGYINATPDTYRISFDKILLEGTTWADALGSSKVTVTENFALIGKNGVPVLDVNDDGSINMNVSSLKVGSYDALTSRDGGVGDLDLADKTPVLSGYEVFTDKADEGGLAHVEIDGKSYQDIEEGSKNLAPSPEHWEYSSGASYDRKTGEATIPVNGVATFWVRWDGRTTNATLSMDTVSGGGFLWETSYYAADKSTRVYDNSNSSTGNAMTPSWSSNPMRASHRTPVLNSNTKWIKMELRGISAFTPGTAKIRNVAFKSGTDSSYETPVLTPDYPIEIHSLNDFDVVSSAGGRNYFAVKDLTPKPYPLVGSDHEYTYSLKPNTTYTIRTWNTEGASFRVNGLNVQYSITGDKGYKVTTDSSGVLRIGLYASSGETDQFINGPARLKLEEGDIATDWTPAPEDITENDNHTLIDKINLLLDEPLRSIGDIRDKLFRDSEGLWKVERNIEERVLDRYTDLYDGELPHYNGDVTTDRFVRSLSRFPYNTKNTKASHFRRMSYSEEEHVWHSNIGGYVANATNNLYIKFPNDVVGIDPSEDPYHIRTQKVKMWLQAELDRGMPVTIQYETQESTIEVLDQELQDKLNNLRSFQDSNYIYTVINDKTDILSESLKPNLNVVFKSKGWKQKSATDKLVSDFLDKVDTQGLGVTLMNLQQEPAAAAASGELSDFIRRYNEDLDARESDKKKSESSLAKAQDSIDLIVNEMGDRSESWNFLERNISNTPEGILVGSKSNGSYILIKEDRISFYSNGSEVAFFSQNLLEVTRGAFVEEMQVGAYKLEGSTMNDHLTFRYVGAPGK